MRCMDIKFCGAGEKCYFSKNVPSLRIYGTWYKTKENMKRLDRLQNITISMNNVMREQSRIVITYYIFINTWLEEVKYLNISSK